MKRVLKTKFAILLLLTTCALGSIHSVPSDFPTIQAGIDASVDGDTVLVAPGTYTGEGNRDITIIRKSVTICSVDANDSNIVAGTIIDCNGTEAEPHYGFFFSEIEASAALIGLTIKNSYAGNGSGISCRNSNLRISRCIIEDGTSFGQGGGIYCSWSQGHPSSKPIVSDCIISGNVAQRDGGGICIVGRACEPVITNCVIIGNTAKDGGGGGISVIGPHCEPVIANCVIVGNSAENGGGIRYYRYTGAISNCTIADNSASDHGGGIDIHGGALSIKNSIVWNNQAPNGSEVSLEPYTESYGDDDATAIISYCDIKGGRDAVFLNWPCNLTWEISNIDRDPLFVDQTRGDYHLRAISPCIDAGESAYRPEPAETDLDGEPRLMGSNVDIGADESNFFPVIPVIGYSSRQFKFASHMKGANPPTQSLFIRNTGTNVLRWEIVEDCHWLEVTPATGDSVEDIDTVFLSVDTSSLIAGSHNCELTIKAEEATNAPIQIAVALFLSDRELHVPAEYATIQEAIDDANKADMVIVADGVYTGDGNRDIDFKGKAITVRSERGPDNCIIDCKGTEEEKHRGFYFHGREKHGSVLESFTITNGFAGRGGAIYCHGSSPTIHNCTIRTNSARLFGDGGRGGGIYCTYSDAVIKDCTIVGNTAIWGVKRGARGLGGGIYCHKGSPSILHCEISDNVQNSGNRTGAIHCYESKARIDNCKISANHGNGLCISNYQVKVTGSVITSNRSDGIHCSYNGYAVIEKCVISSNQQAGIRSTSGDVAVTHCLIEGNRGGGVHCGRSKLVTVNNSTIVDNFAHMNGGGIFCEGTNCNIRNCIIWGNQPLENQIWLRWGSIDNGPYLCTVSYSNVQGAMETVGIVGDFSLNWGEGNINLDPCFVRAGYLDDNGTLWDYIDDYWVLGDYHLKSQAGRWDPVGQSWVIDDVTSPCIDAGDPNSPVGLEPFPNGGRINIGAYGGTIEASKSYFGEP